MAKKPTPTTTALATEADDPRWTPRADMLARMRVTRPTIESHVKAGRIRKTSLGNKVFYSAADVDRLLAANSTQLSPA